VDRLEAWRGVGLRVGGWRLGGWDVGVERGGVGWVDEGRLCVGGGESVCLCAEAGAEGGRPGGLAVTVVGVVEGKGGMLKDEDKRYGKICSADVGRS